jgi:ankyrin repeat protein
MSGVRGSLLLCHHGSPEAGPRWNWRNPARSRCCSGRFQGRPPAAREEGQSHIQSSNGRTVLHVAAEKGHATVVELLLQKGAELDSKDKEYGQTALHVTAENGHEAVLKLLIEKDSVDPDSKYTFYSWTPLWWAAANGYEAVVKLLLERGLI